MPFPSPGDLPDPGIEPGSLALQVDSLPSEPPGKPILKLIAIKKKILLHDFDQFFIKKIFFSLKGTSKEKSIYIPSKVILYIPQGHSTIYLETLCKDTRDGGKCF